MLDELVEILKIEDIFRHVVLILTVPFLVIIAKTIITNFIAERAEAKQNEIYSKV